MSKLFLYVVFSVLLFSPTAFGFLVFDVKNHDFGVIQRGETPYYDFRFTNQGAGRFRIAGVDATCGCIGVEHEPGKSYAPGEAGYLRVHFSSADFSGRFSQDVLVWAGKGRPIRLGLKAQIKSSFTLKPPLADFALLSENNDREVSPKDSTVKEISVKENLIKTFIINLERQSNSNIKLVKLENNLNFLSDAVIVGDSQLKLTLKDELVKGKYFGVVKVFTNDRFLKEIKVPVIATVETDLKLEPQYLEFGSIAKGSSRSRFLKVSSAEFADLQLTQSELSINGENLSSPQLKIVKEKSGFSVTIMNQSKVSGAFSGILNLMQGEILMAELKYFGFFR